VLKVNDVGDKENVSGGGIIPPPPLPPPPLLPVAVRLMVVVLELPPRIAVTVAF
jgi:hypothetical protein